jgi:hypothetical protein
MTSRIHTSLEKGHMLGTSLSCSLVCATKQYIDKADGLLQKLKSTNCTAMVGLAILGPSMWSIPCYISSSRGATRSENTVSKAAHLGYLPIASKTLQMLS